MKKPYNHGASTIWDAINISKESMPEVYTKAILSLKETSLSKSVEEFEKFLMDNDKAELSLEKLRATIFIFLDTFEHYLSLKDSIRHFVSCGMEEMALDNKVYEYQKEKEAENSEENKEAEVDISKN